MLTFSKLILLIAQNSVYLNRFSNQHYGDELLHDYGGYLISKDLQCTKFYYSFIKKFNT